MNKSTSYRHLTAFEERHNCKMTEEDVIDVINALQLYLKFEEKGEMNNTDKKSTAKRGTTSDKKVRTKMSENKVKETNKKNTKKNTQTKKNETSQTSIKESNTETNAKKKTNESSEKEKVMALMTELKKMPTREDLKTNNVNIDNLMVKYGSWRKIKDSLKLADKYEEILCKQLSELKKTDKLTMENCRAKDIDISFLIRKYGGWKQVLKQAKIA